MADSVTGETQLIETERGYLTPREIRLERAATILRNGAILHAGLVILALILALLGGTGTIPNLFTNMHNVMLGRVSIAADTALAVVILLLLVDLSLLLVLMVGVLAREIWVLAGLWLVVGVNILAIPLLGFLPGIISAIIVGWAGAITMRDTGAFRLNPVMLKELRGRMRGMRAFVVMTVYLGLMSSFTALLYIIQVGARFDTSGTSVVGEIGRVLFLGLVGIELLLIIFIAPAFTAGAITGERERRTYDLLRTTLLASPSFVIGKLETALAYILLLLFSAIPLQSVAFLFGGVTELELLLAFIILTVTAITLGTVGIFFSAITPRTLSASVRSYIVALAVTFGIPIILSLPLMNAFSRTVAGIGSGINTSGLLESIFIYLGLLLVSLNPVSAAQISQQLLADHQIVGFWTVTLASDGSTIPIVAPWISFSVLYLVISAVLVVIAVRKMRQLEVED